MIHENPMIFKDGLTLDKLPYIVWSTHNDLKMNAIHLNHTLKEFGKVLPPLSKKFTDYFVHESYWIKKRKELHHNIILLLLSIPFIIALGCLLGHLFGVFFSFIGGATCGLIGNLIGNMLAQSYVIKQNLEKMRRGDSF